MPKFIEVKDIFGQNILIDPMSVIAVRENKRKNEKANTIVYFYNLHINLSEPYEEIKHKLNEAIPNF